MRASPLALGGRNGAHRRLLLAAGPGEAPGGQEGHEEAERAHRIGDRQLLDPPLLDAPRPLAELLELPFESGAILSQLRQRGDGEEPHAVDGAPATSGTPQECALQANLGRLLCGVEDTLTPLESVPAVGSALAPRCPILPYTVLQLPVAQAWAVGNLLRSSYLAGLAPALGMLRDVPGALPLAPALVAAAPIFPVVPQAVHGGASRLARLSATRLRLGEIGIAALATVIRLLDDHPAAVVLGTSARGRASAPLTPSAELAVISRALGVAIFVAIARPILLQGSNAEFAAAAALVLDGTGTTLDAVAFLCAIAPLAPFLKGAIHVLHTNGVAVARGCFVRRAHRRLSADVRLCLHLPCPPCGSASARCGTSLPIAPMVPEAVDTALDTAFLRVARLQLFLVLCRARLSSVFR
mmetsp:Transcript_51920/g.110965  ORF Transcript_51920/g.110965 Transcript_51920/m.110965 type:complete len:412 (-) Transcript_51920:4300-5535(-)